VTNHPNRSKARPVATCIDRAVILGHAKTEGEALLLLRTWATENNLGEIMGAKLADVMIDLPEPGQYRTPRAWIPIPA
jgi:hypothetical protein